MLAQGGIVYAEGNGGTVSAFAVSRADGQLMPLNTVPSGGAGPTYVSLHPSGKFILVANYFGGTVAVLPILPDGRLGVLDFGAVARLPPGEQTVDRSNRRAA